MRYFYHTLPHILISTFFVLFFSIPLAEASVIIRPPNNLGLVGYWSFDEGRGTQASDLSGNGNNGVLANSPEWVSGKAGSALNFNGSGKRVTLPNPVSGSNISVAVWYKRDDAEASGSWRTILGHLTSNIHHLIIHSTSRQIGVFDGSSRMFNYVPPNDGNWHHYVVLYENGVSATLYVDGVYVDSISVVLSLAVNPIGSIGNWGGGGYWAGPIDDVRIYSRALSAPEIQSLYSNTKSTVVGEAPSNYYSDGLVAHYTLDGSTLSGATVSDVVGTSNGTLTAGPVPTLGRIGQGMLFNGTAGGIDLGTPSALQITGDQTISMWLYPENFSARRNPFAKAYGGEGTITQEISGTLSYYYGTYGGNSNPYQALGSSTPLVLNTWNHAAIVRDLSSNPMRLRWYINGVETRAGNATYAAAVASTNSALIGQGYVSRYAGVIDDVRIYNRALSANEVRGLAGGGFGELNSSTDDLLRNGLAGFWSFDSDTVSGSTVQDLSNNGNNATIIGGTSLVAGKIGEAMEFDGVNDYVDVGNDNSLKNLGSEVTVSVWAKYNAYGGGGQSYSVIVVKGFPWTFLLENPSSRIRFRVSAGGVDSSAQDSTVHELNRWYHFVGTYDGTNIRIYKDGVQVGVTPRTGALGVNDITAKIGTYQGTNYNFNGFIDDVRIYNRALTPQEVEQLYYMGN